jgi:dolichol-phosphate mannosyltransferase
MTPVYNEAETIGELLERLLNLDDSLGCVVVDDNSPDGTGDIVREIAARHPARVTLVQRPGRMGRASAGIRGFQEAIQLQPTYIVEMDADLSHAPEDVTTFLQEVHDCDVVVGSRFVNGGRDADRSLFRRQISIVSSQVFRLILGLKVRDIGSGFKLYRREVLQSLPWPEFYAKGIAISMEELFRIAKKGYRIKEVPIVFTDRRAGSSKLRKSDFVEPLQVALRLALTQGRVGGAP